MGRIWPHFIVPNVSVFMTKSQYIRNLLITHHLDSPMPFFKNRLSSLTMAKTIFTFSTKT